MLRLLRRPALRKLAPTTQFRKMSVDFSMKDYDPVQVQLMGERCILVNEKDEVIGHESKKNCTFLYSFAEKVEIPRWRLGDAIKYFYQGFMTEAVAFLGHLMTNINKGMLHRAFSVFLFNSKGELLLQQRASEKITFPDYWTNTCCSHPLYVPDELPEENNTGVRVAARRKLEHELGIDPATINLDDFKYLTRIHYVAGSDDIWGEHEIDHILFLRKDVPLNPSPNEVRDTKYLSQEEMRKFIAGAKDNGIKLTPWFALIADDFLWKWWDNLDKLDAVADTATIHNMTNKK